MSQNLEQKVQKKKLGVGTKLAIGAGIAAVGSYLIIKNVGEKVWKIVYPPTFKKYLAIGTLVALSYYATHYSYVNEKIGETLKKVKLSASITNYLKKENKGLKETVKELSEGRVQFQEKYKQKEQELTKNEAELTQKDESIKDLQQKLKVQTGITFTPRQNTLPSVTDNKELSYFVQKKGTNLVEIARNVTGNSSNWKEIAEYNNKEVIPGENGPVVIINMGERLRIPSEYVRDYSKVMNLSKEEIPKAFYLIRKGESFRQAIISATGSLEHLDEVTAYNKSFMPSFSKRYAEILWIPSKIAKKKSSSRHIKIYPSRLSKNDYTGKRYH